ncbi:MAG TPA: GlsB/YeaQ/YmgE family stress response membrane protein [Ktedonobacterales bacterium]|nr:GlsB/YeaQ/YmgE family stress response membrane protein [Ktedonobacterales bacterium]
MSILAWIVVGVIAGFLAKAVVPGEGSGGIIGDLIVGVVGAVVGGWIMTAIGYGGPNGINVWSIFVAFLGAAALLWASRAFTSNKTLN